LFGLYFLFSVPDFTHDNLSVSHNSFILFGKLKFLDALFRSFNFPLFFKLFSGIGLIVLPISDFLSSSIDPLISPKSSFSELDYPDLFTGGT
jgi:hypothetical protein